MKAIGSGCCALILALAASLSPAHAQDATINSYSADLEVDSSNLDAAGAISLSLSSAAAGEVFVNQGLVGNHITTIDLTRQSTIDEAFFNNQGIVDVNQDSGAANNQANVRVIAIAMEGGAVDLQSVVASVASDNTLDTSGGSSKDSITNSFGGSAGILGVNQSSGSLNQQANVMLIGIGAIMGPGTPLLADTTLATVATGSNNTVNEGTPRPRSDVIDNSLTGFQGAAQISQSAGDLNTINNTMAISVMGMGAP